MAPNHELDCLVKRLDLLCCGQGQGHRKGSEFQWMFILDDISATAEYFATKLSMMMHHHGPECHAKRLICYFQGRGHCKSSYDQNKTISTVSFELLILFATKLGLIVHYYKKLDCCVQGQGHSKISKCKWMFVQMIFSESLNLLLPNLVI